MPLKWGSETVARTETKQTENHRATTSNGNRANLGFEAPRFFAADKKSPSRASVRRATR